MSDITTITVVPDSEDASLKTQEDWSKFEPQTEEELNAAALADPDSPALEWLIARGWRKGVNVKRLRERLGMTQEEFAKTYWIPLERCATGSSEGRMPIGPRRRILR